MDESVDLAENYGSAALLTSEIILDAFSRRVVGWELDRSMTYYPPYAKASCGFDRVTGQPLWSIEECPVPRSDVLGEEIFLPGAIADHEAENSSLTAQHIGVYSEALRGFFLAKAPSVDEIGN